MTIGHPVKKPAGMKILMIDDDKKLCRLVADYLEPMGYKVSVAHNDVQGLEGPGGWLSRSDPRCHDATNGRVRSIEMPAPRVRYSRFNAHG